MKNTLEVPWSGDPYAPEITLEQAASLGITPEDIAAGEKRGTVSPYRSSDGAPASYRPACLVSGFPSKGNLRIYPARTLSDCRQCGYEIEGRARLNGARFRGFSTSFLVSVAGTLVSLAAVHVCLDRAR